MKFLDPEGNPASWSPLQEQRRAARMAEDDPFQQRRLAKQRRLGELLREGASSGEITSFIGERTQAQRDTEIGISLDTPLGFTKRGAPIYPILGSGERIYLLQNSSQPTTAAPVKQPTGNAIRTMQQLECASTGTMTIVEWGISFDASAAATGIEVELFRNTVAATMSTAAVSGDVSLLNQPNDAATQLAVFGGTTHTGFATGAVTEGTVANYGLYDLQLVQPTNQYLKQWPLGREPEVPVSKLVRIRVTASATVNQYSYICWSE